MWMDDLLRLPVLGFVFTIITMESIRLRYCELVSFVFQSDMLFLNCGHVCACSKCAELLHECPLDRSKIVQKIHLQPSSSASSSAFPAEDDAAFWSAVVFPSSVVDVVALYNPCNELSISFNVLFIISCILIIFHFLLVKFIHEAKYLFICISYIY